MEKQTISRDELHKVPHNLLVDMFLQLNSSLTIMQQQNETLIKQVSNLQESIAVLTQQRFGRKTEKLSEISGQLSLAFDFSDIVNEAEGLPMTGFRKNRKSKQWLSAGRPKPRENGNQIWLV